MDTLLEQVCRSPKLLLYVQEIERLLQEERRKREQFYHLVSENDQAEFINGKIVFHPAITMKQTVIGRLLLTFLDTCIQINNLGYVGYEERLISFTRNDYKPDLCFFHTTDAQQFPPPPIAFPAPDFIVEVISESTEEYDRGVKFEDYAAHGVKEYWIIDPDEEIVEQYLLRRAQYELLQKTDSGILKSHAIPGVNMPVRAIFDEQEHLKALQIIIG